MPKPKPCPCASGRPYRACCEPYHAGAEPPDPSALVRSRYAAFALKDARYLWRTLHAEHEDRARDEGAFARAIRGSQLRFMGLQILDAAPSDEAGIARVLFLAKVFDRGRELSFVELSGFRHDGEGFRYLSGITVPARALPGGGAGLTIAAFEQARPR
ncbi:MAG TPA: YchJ family metal-binding protein [Candidatus Nanopelagicales bacterium]|nr:YchJ family metal-binding protein [Candidatus Nanopelagicales bacterium]